MQLEAVYLEALLYTNSWHLIFWSDVFGFHKKKLSTAIYFHQKWELSSEFFKDSIFDNADGREILQEFMKLSDSKKLGKFLLNS